jgi:hypothetical protein
MVHIFVPVRFSSRMKAKGKTHKCFPNRNFNRLEAALQAISSIPLLTLAMPAAIALATAFLVDHRVTAALRAEVAGDTQVAQAEG